MKNLLLTCLVLLVVPVRMMFGGDFEDIKSRVVADILVESVDDEVVASLLNTLCEDGTWPGIDYSNFSRTAFEHKVHSANMFTLARAYNLKDSEFYHSKKVKRAIELSLNNWVENDYQSENWWYNQINTPGIFVNIMLLLGDELDSDLVAKAGPIIARGSINAQGARPGGDRIKIAGIHAKNMLFLGDKNGFEDVIRIIEDEIKFVEWIGMKDGYPFREIKSGFQNLSEPSGRGLQYDYSFHHRTDGINNTLAYGSNFAQGFIDWGYYVRGTKYAFSEEKIKILVNYFLDGICKMTVFGLYPDVGATNRGISRVDALHAYNADMVERLMQLSEYRAEELQAIEDIRNREKKAESSHARFYWDTEYFTFQRPDFFSSVRMYSTRMYNMEYPHNSEGILNHHMGDGANYVYRTGDEYFNIAPVFDYQKVPGTTIMQKEKLPSEKEVAKPGLSDFVGATIDGNYAAVAFDFMSPHDPLIARKSWFYFDNEYVCLGAGISCREQLPVVTTLNQSLLRDDVTVCSGNDASILEKGEKTYENVDWVYHDGIGYVFPEPQEIWLKNEEATGSWTRINKQTNVPKEEVRKEVFKLWIDHGRRPSDGSYEYIVVPANSAGNIQQYVDDNTIDILSNTIDIQAVKNRELNMCQLVFYNAGTIELDNSMVFSCESPGIVILQLEGNKISRISVSDPNRELSRMHLSLKSERGETRHFSIDLPQGNYRGSSTTIEI